MTCTCPTHHTDSGIQRFARDIACPVHGARTQELPHCSTCTCGAVPIVQTPETAASAALRLVKGEQHD